MWITKSSIYFFSISNNFLIVITDGIVGTVIDYAAIPQPELVKCIRHGLGKYIVIQYNYIFVYYTMKRRQNVRMSSPYPLFSPEEPPELIANKYRNIGADSAAAGKSKHKTKS